MVERLSHKAELRVFPVSHSETVVPANWERWERKAKPLPMTPMAR